ncbi:hypothetical protein Tco_0131489, partial [Tanacetum coccineum]
TDRAGEPDDAIQPPSIPPKKDTQTDEGTDESLEKSLGSKPLAKVVIHIIGGNLSTECRSGLIEMLQHKRKTYPHIDPRVQRKQSMALDRRKVGKDEVAEWLKARIVRMVRYPIWVANPVLVKKPDSSWRMCIDFKNLNKACPKDLYPLLEIDWKIESLMGFKYKCFLDAYKEYYQI